MQAHRCRARLDHLDAAEAENLSEWNNTRLKRLLVDYLLRMSYYDSATKLAECSNIQVMHERVCIIGFCPLTTVEFLLYVCNVYTRVVHVSVL